MQALQSLYGALGYEIEITGVFDAIAASLVVYGLLIAGALLIRPWGSAGARG